MSPHRRFARGPGLGFYVPMNDPMFNPPAIDDSPLFASPAPIQQASAAADLAAVGQAIESDVTRIAAKQLPAHLFMPPDGVSFDVATYIALPAVGATSAIVSFVVPDGFHGVINRLSNVYVGTGFVEGSGRIVWQILSNGAVVRNYDNIVASLGAVAQPSSITGILIKEGQLITLQLQNVSLAVGGAQTGGRLGGWFYPTSYEPDDTWL
jgi:hypothetical protein